MQVCVPQTCSEQKAKLYLQNRFSLFALPFGIPDWFYGEGVLYPMFLCKFAFRKLVANRRPNYICKTDFHCSPCPLESQIGSAKMGLYPSVFMQVCRKQTCVGGDSIESSKGCSLPPNKNCKRTVNQVMSVRQIHPVRPASF